MTNLTRPAAALKSAEEIATLETDLAFLYKEARLLDDRQFDEWLQCYQPDSEFWMPAWDVDDRLTEDPQNEISLIYYDNRGGIEDRIFRIKTDRSSATSGRCRRRAGRRHRGGGIPRRDPDDDGRDRPRRARRLEPVEQDAPPRPLTPGGIHTEAVRARPLSNPSGARSVLHSLPKESAE